MSDILHPDPPNVSGIIPDPAKHHQDVRAKSDQMVEAYVKQHVGNIANNMVTIGTVAMHLLRAQHEELALFRELETHMRQDSITKECYQRIMGELDEMRARTMLEAQAASKPQ